MVAFSLPEKVSKPLQSLSRSPLLMSVALHAAILLIPLALWSRSQSLVPESEQVNLVQLPPVTEGTTTDPGLAPLSDVPLPPAPPDGGFAASDGGFAASDGGFAASDGGFTASDGGFAASDGGFAASDDAPLSFDSQPSASAGSGFVAPAPEEAAPVIGSGADTPAVDSDPAIPSPSPDNAPSRPEATRPNSEPSVPTTPVPQQPVTSLPLAPPNESPAQASNPAEVSPADASRDSETADTSRAAVGEEFPRFEGAQQVSFAAPLLYDNPNSFQTSGQLADVKNWYEEELRSRGYAIAPLANETGRVVLALTRGGVTQYLHLLASDQGDQTNIVLSQAPLPENLDLKVEEPAIANFFQELGIPVPGQMLDATGNLVPQESDDESTSQDGLLWRNLTVDQLATPTAFYQSAEARLVAPPAAQADNVPVDCTAQPNQCQAVDPAFVEGVRRGVVRSGQPIPEGVIRELAPALQGYEVRQLPERFAGGLLYELRRGDITAYLSLVPTKDGTSTAVVLWNRSPI